MEKIITPNNNREHTSNSNETNENRTPEIVNHNSHEIPPERGSEMNSNNSNTETHNNLPESNPPENLNDLMDFGDNDYIPDN